MDHNWFCFPKPTFKQRFDLPNFNKRKGLSSDSRNPSPNPQSSPVRLITDN